MKIFFLMLASSTLLCILGLFFFPSYLFKESDSEILARLNAPPNWSPVERLYLQKSGYKAIYPGEHLPSIEVKDVHELGKLTALKFIHWISTHPEGVVALPTGKTPQFFIESISYYKTHWKDSEVQQDLKSFGIPSSHFPETKKLKFVQLYEFFPMDFDQVNSSTSYIKRNYLALLEIPEENVLKMEMCHSKKFGASDLALLSSKKIDLRLLGREPLNQKETQIKTLLLQVERQCQVYEEAVRALGGIGFFLGEIGPDGHIAFNMKGSDPYSATRLVRLNYPTAAGAAGDVGGMEYARNKTAVTIGLGTILFNPDATAIVLAAGEAKAPVIRNALESKSDMGFPATALHALKGARCYVTKGAASLIEARRIEDIKRKPWNALSKEEIDEVVIDLALKKKKRLKDLTQLDFESEPKSAALLEKCPRGWSQFSKDARERLVNKIENPLPQGLTILHTSPHHDDVELAYYPLVRALLKNNHNDFAYVTSGFNAVTDRYILNLLNAIPEETFEQDDSSIFRIFKRLNMAFASRFKGKEWVILLKNISEIYHIENTVLLKEKVRWLKEEYFPQKQIGEKDCVEVQKIKGAMRESETDRMLARLGIPLPRIYHLRAQFYTDNLSSKDVNVAHLAELCEDIKPNLITVAFDPEDGGPETHYKVLQMTAQALRKADLSQDIKIWGYRNVWNRFKFSEANVFFPVLEEEMEELDWAFRTCFLSQRSASFPSSLHDGPFSELMINIQKEYRHQLGVLLGKSYFQKHPRDRIQKAKGFVMLLEMDREKFLNSVRKLQNSG